MINPYLTFYQVLNIWLIGYAESVAIIGKQCFITEQNRQAAAALLAKKRSSSSKGKINDDSRPTIKMIIFYRRSPSNEIQKIL